MYTLMAKAILYITYPLKTAALTKGFKNKRPPQGKDGEELL